MYLTYSQLGFAALMMLGLGAIVGVLVMSMMVVAKNADAQLAAEPPFGGGMSLEEAQSAYNTRMSEFLDNTFTTSNGPHVVSEPDAWKHAVPKVPHADASAATFHRAGDA